MLPELHVGDVIGIHCSGAYGVTASPAHFISHDLPAENHRRRRRADHAREQTIEGESQRVLEISSRKQAWGVRSRCRAGQGGTVMSRYERIVGYIRENMEPEFDPGEDALSQVLDSVSLLQLISFIDQDLGIPLDLEGLTLIASPRWRPSCRCSASTAARASRTEACRKWPCLAGALAMATRVSRKGRATSCPCALVPRPSRRLPGSRARPGNTGRVRVRTPLRRHAGPRGR